DIADGTGGVVAADHRGQCRAAAAIAVEYVLDDLFPALVLKVHVDVRRFVALAGQEAFEQQVGAGRVDLSDAQGKAHRRVGSRATALAEDALPPGEADDVVHGEEVAFVFQLADQGQFLVELGAQFAGDAPGPAPGDAFLGEVAQPAGRGVVRGHQLPGVLV